MKTRHSQQGSALIVTLFVIIILVAFAGSYVAVTVKHSVASDNNIASVMSFYAAESGLDACLASLNNMGNGHVHGHLPGIAGPGMSFHSVAARTDGIDNDGNGVIDDAGETGTYAGAWYQAQPTGAFDFFAWGADRLDNDEDGEIDEADEKDTYTGEIFSVGSAGGYVTTVCARVIGIRSSVFTMAIFGDESVDIAGAKTLTDSYDSHKGSYVDQLTTWGKNNKDDDGDGEVDEWDETTHANNQGNVGSNGIIRLKGQPDIFGDVLYFAGLDIGKGRIYGNVAQMPTKIALDPITPSELAAAAANNNNANIMLMREVEVQVEKTRQVPREIEVWEDFNCGNRRCNKCRGGALGCKRKVRKTIWVTETYFEKEKVIRSTRIEPPPTSLDVKPKETVSLPAGTYYFESIDVKGDVHIDGNVIIYCTGDVKFRCSSKVFNTSRKPTDLTLLSTGAEVELTANVDFYGAIYAPNARIKIKSNETDLFGSVVGKTIELGGNAAVHYDEALGDKGWSPRFLWAITSWEIRHKFSAESRNGGRTFEQYYELD